MIHHKNYDKKQALSVKPKRIIQYSTISLAFQSITYSFSKNSMFLVVVSSY
jgi:hypothetical protein